MVFHTPPTETVTAENQSPNCGLTTPQPPLKFGSKPALDIYAKNYTFHGRSKENLHCLHCNSPKLISEYIDTIQKVFWEDDTKNVLESTK